MGQYYMPVVKDIKAKRINTYYSHDYNNGRKLIEHSYINNNFVNIICNKIFHNPCKVCWVGDYAVWKEDKELFSSLPNFNRKSFYKLKQKAWKTEKYTKAPLEEQKFSWGKTKVYLINNTLKQYVNLQESPKIKNWGGRFNYLPLLTAVGNGKGGGDFYGEGEENIGKWAYHELYIDFTAPQDYEQVHFTFIER